MAAADVNYNTANYQRRGGDLWHIGGKLELGNGVVLDCTAGVLKITGLPTADPHVVGELWANSGVLTVSAG